MPTRSECGTSAPRQVVGGLVGQRGQVGRQCQVGLMSQDIANEAVPGHPPRPAFDRSHLGYRLSMHGDGDALAIRDAIEQGPCLVAQLTRRDLSHATSVAIALRPDPGWARPDPFAAAS